MYDMYNIYYVCVYRRAIKEFQFWLFSDRLLYGEAVQTLTGPKSLNSNLANHTNTTANSTSTSYNSNNNNNTHNRMYNLNRIILLQECRLVHIDEDFTSKSACAFGIEAPAKSFILWASSSDERDEW